MIKRSLDLDYPPSVDEAKAIKERMDRGEMVGAVERGSANYSRAGHYVIVRYPNGKETALRNAKGEYLLAPSNEDLVIPAEQAIDLGLSDWEMILPPDPKKKPVFPLPPFGNPATLEGGVGLIEWILAHRMYQLDMETYNRQVEFYTKPSGGSQNSHGVGGDSVR